MDGTLILLDGGGMSIKGGDFTRNTLGIKRVFSMENWIIRSIGFLNHRSHWDLSIKNDVMV